MNVSLTKQLNRYVAEKIAGGRYGSASEVIREALRQMEERELREESVSLQAKISSGLRTPLRPVTAAGWRSKWKTGLALAQKLREQRRAA
jgi:antitoxin ParD1/3/4